MNTPHGHLTYCTNIHAGEGWNEHFTALRQNVPAIKQAVSPLEPFAIGLRLANTASLELRKEERLREFQAWLRENNCYVFIINGFPYGGFHDTVVKDKVHAPDWLSADRVQYTIRLAQILAVLLPEGMTGGISTSPLTYRFWHKEEQLPSVFETATLNLLQVVDQLIGIKNSTGKIIHIDLEPEPDGLLGDGKEFLQWYSQYMMPLGTAWLKDKHGYNEDEAAAAVKEHIRICYDVCHFAVSYEDHRYMIEQLRSLGIKTGRIQISAALKAAMPSDIAARKTLTDTFKQFDEPVYLHQVIAKCSDGNFIRYPDMPGAQADGQNPLVTEWRAHYHVPLFMENYGLLQSTRSDINEVLAVQKNEPFTSYLEVETYTWGVLPEDIRLPITESLIRELNWALGALGQ